MIGEGELKIYQRNVIRQRVNLKEGINKQLNSSSIAFCYPLLCYATNDKAYLKMLLTPLTESIDLPEEINSISLNYDQEKQKGLIICSGKVSFSLYAIEFQLNNIESLALQLTNLHFHE